MILSLESQAISFIATIISGILMGFTYDIFRFFRKYIKHPNFLIHIEDILYWIICIFISYLIILHISMGEIRFFTLLGIIIGIIFYIFAFSSITMKLFEFFAKLIIRFFKISVIPAKFVNSKTEKPRIYAKNKLLRGAYNLKILLKKIYFYVKINIRKFKYNLKIIIKKF